MAKTFGNRTIVLREGPTDEKSVNGVFAPYDLPFNITSEIAVSPKRLTKFIVRGCLFMNDFRGTAYEHLMMPPLYADTGMDDPAHQISDIRNRVAASVRERFGSSDSAQTPEENLFDWVLAVTELYFANVHMTYSESFFEYTGEILNVCKLKLKKYDYNVESALGAITARPRMAVRYHARKWDLNTILLYHIRPIASKFNSASSMEKSGLRILINGKNVPSQFHKYDDCGEVVLLPHTDRWLKARDLCKDPNKDKLAAAMWMAPWQTFSTDGYRHLTRINANKNPMES